MWLDKKEAYGPIYKKNDDPNVTKVGKFTREFSLDEFPQIVNIIKCEMSIITPARFLHMDRLAAMNINSKDLL